MKLSTSYDQLQTCFIYQLWTPDLRFSSDWDARAAEILQWVTSPTCLFNKH